MPALGKLAAPARWPKSAAVGDWQMGAAMRRGAAVVAGHVNPGEVAAARRLADFAHACMSWLRGGLGLATLRSCGVFAAISGSNSATTATIGGIMHPLLVKDGYSYGPLLDGLIAAAAHSPVRTSVEPMQMSLMLVSKRADWMIVSPEEAAVLTRPGLQLTPLADAPAGPTRHLYCSSDVPAGWLARIDDALRALRR